MRQHLYVVPCSQPGHLGGFSSITWHQVHQRRHNVAASSYWRRDCLEAPMTLGVPPGQDSTAIVHLKPATLWLKRSGGVPCWLPALRGPWPPQIFRVSKPSKDGDGLAYGVSTISWQSQRSIISWQFLPLYGWRHIDGPIVMLFLTTPGLQCPRLCLMELIYMMWRIPCISMSY